MGRVSQGKRIRREKKTNRRTCSVQVGPPLEIIGPSTKGAKFLAGVATDVDIGEAQKLGKFDEGVLLGRFVPSSSRRVGHSVDFGTSVEHLQLSAVWIGQKDGLQQTFICGRT